MSKKRKKPKPFEDKGLYETGPQNNERDRFLWEETETNLTRIRKLHPLLCKLERAQTPAQKKEAQAAIDRDPIASEIQLSLHRFELEESDHTLGLPSLLAAVERAETPTDRKAAIAAIDQTKLPKEVKDYLRVFEKDEEFRPKNLSEYQSGFRAGWHLAFAYLLATAGETARHGKKMDYRKAAEAAKRKRAERGTRAKKLPPLKAAVLDAWKDYQEDNGADASPSAFVKWLYHDADIYDIEASRIDEEFRKAGESVKGETIRKNWLK